MGHDKLDQYKGCLNHAQIAEGINAAQENARRLAEDAVVIRCRHLDDALAEVPPWRSALALRAHRRERALQDIAHRLRRRDGDQALRQLLLRASSQVRTTPLPPEQRGRPAPCTPPARGAEGPLATLLQSQDRQDLPWIERLLEAVRAARSDGLAAPWRSSRRGVAVEVSPAGVTLCAGYASAARSLTVPLELFADLVEAWPQVRDARRPQPSSGDTASQGEAFRDRGFRRNTLPLPATTGRGSG